MKYCLVLPQYVYTGELNQKICATDALDVLYAATKYDIQELEVECLKLLKGRMAEENAVSIYQTAQLLDVSDLAQEASAFIIRFVDNIFFIMSQGFGEMCPNIWLISIFSAISKAS